jgi:hypothetical protein
LRGYYRGGDRSRAKGPRFLVSWRGRLPLQAGELRFQKRVVGCACFRAFEPLQVPCDPRVTAFTRKAREDIRPKEVIELSLGALPVHTRLPLPGLLMAMLPVGQLPQLLWEASVSATTPSALSNACPVRSARDFARCARTCSTIPESVCSGCNVSSLRGWPKTPSLHALRCYTLTLAVV